MCVWGNAEWTRPTIDRPALWVMDKPETQYDYRPTNTQPPRTCASFSSELAERLIESAAGSARSSARTRSHTSGVASGAGAPALVLAVPSSLLCGFVSCGVCGY